jgi:pimeloyl-ACP methyl ester carboxylesterase
VLGLPEARVNGIMMNYAIEGEGAPLVLIIGIGSDLSNWRLQVGAFKKHYLAITLDNRGAGKSEKPAGPYTIRLMAEDTLSLMDHLGVEKADILGVSMGGMIAQELAINHPERVEKLILGCTFASRRGDSGFTPEITGAIDAYLGSSREEANLKKLAITIIDSSFNKSTYRIAILPLMKTAIKSVPLRGFAEQLDALLAHDAESRLEKIAAPTLVLTGTEDRVIKPSSSAVIAGLVPNAKLVKVAGGSHGFSGEMSKEFNNAVLEFLKTG